MATDYRVYRLDRANQVVFVEWLTADTDDEAISIARNMHRGSKREIWIGERLLATINPDAAEEPSGAFWL
jgi:hypothetical protein